VVGGEKEIFSGGHFATGTGLLELWEKLGGRQGNNREQVFKAGGGWHSLGNGLD
jgi:hypothetical protein